MADWLVVMSEDNRLACIGAGLLGLGRGAERRLNRMAQGDRVWIYVNRRWVDKQTPRLCLIKSIAVITGPVRRLDKPPWASRRSQTFPHARPISIERSFDLPAGDLLPSLSFAAGKTRWGLSLLNAPILLSLKDVQQLHAALKRSIGR